MTERESSPRLSGEPPNRCWFRIGVWGLARAKTWSILFIVLIVRCIKMRGVASLIVLRRLSTQAE